MLRFSPKWQLVHLHALLISLFVLGLFYYWFVIANRYVIFLYNHLGAAPFGESTRSRYWMTGLVASGAITILYTIINWLLARIAGLRYHCYQPPMWWRVWLVSTPILVIGIPLITMTQNQPTMPFSIAALCTGTAVSGLALALIPAALVAQQTSELIWYTLFGVGLMPELLLLRALELPGQGLATISKAYWLAIGSVVIGSIWLSLLSWLRALAHKPVIQGHKILIAGLNLSYVVLPLVHYLFFVPPRYRYISTSANFFALSPYVQLLSIGLTALVAIGTARFQYQLQKFFTPVTI